MAGGAAAVAVWWLERDIARVQRWVSAQELFWEPNVADGIQLLDHGLGGGRQASLVQHPVRAELLAVGGPSWHLLETWTKGEVVTDRVLPVWLGCCGDKRPVGVYKLGERQRGRDGGRRATVNREKREGEGRGEENKEDEMEREKKKREDETKRNESGGEGCWRARCKQT